MKIYRIACQTLAALLICTAASSALAGQFSAVINGKSFHVGASEDWNEGNYGLGIEYQFATETRWKTVMMANAFKDSNDAMSYMVGGGLHRNLFASEKLAGFYVDLGINAFMMTREDVNDNRPFPGVLPSLTVGNRYVGVNLTYLPSAAVEEMYDARMLDDSMNGIVFLQLKLNASLFFGGD
jgi:hypothetical protein